MESNPTPSSTTNTSSNSEIHLGTWVGIMFGSEYRFLSDGTITPCPNSLLNMSQKVPTSWSSPSFNYSRNEWVFSFISFLWLIRKHQGYSFQTSVNIATTVGYKSLIIDNPFTTFSLFRPLDSSSRWPNQIRRPSSLSPTSHKTAGDLLW